MGGFPIPMGLFHQIPPPSARGSQESGPPVALLQRNAMTLLPQITFRNMESDARTEALILAEIEKLERYFPRLMSCRVAVEAPVRKAVHYKVRVDLGVPGQELVVKRSPSLHETLAGAETTKKTKAAEIQRARRALGGAIKEAFVEMRRQLEDHVRVLRGDVKAHGPAPEARVIRIFPQEGYGFLETQDRREVYFHRNAVLDGHFDQLRPGSRVSYAEEEGEKGPQASTVRLMQPKRQLRAAATQVVLTPQKPRPPVKSARGRNA